MSTASLEKTAIGQQDAGTDTTSPPPLSGGWLVLIRGLWAAVAVLIVVLYALSIPSRLAQISVEALELNTLQYGLTPVVFATYISILDTLTLGATLAIAIILFLRKSDDWVALFVSFMLVTYGLQVVRDSSALADVQPIVKQLINYVRYINIALVILFMYMFPDGRFAPRWSRLIAFPLIVYTAARVALPNTQINLDNWPALVGFAVIASLLLSGIIAQIYRYEEVSSQAQKRQTKWVVLGLAMAFTGFVIFTVPAIIIPQVAEPTIQRMTYIALGVPFLYVSLLLLPIMIAVSITRYRLWDIDFLINRSLIYGALTVGLGLIFLISVIALQFVFQSVTGGSQSPLALAVSTLVIGALFQPTRTAVRRFVDRRMYGIQIRYDTPQPGSVILWETPAGYLLGTKLGAYHVEEHLGRGGMADVYKGKHRTLHKPVAIKVLPEIYAKESNFRHRFEREAKLIGALGHPNIVQMYDHGEQDGTFYMVMEYINGPELADVIRQRAPMPLAEARMILLDVASALDHAHAHGIIHRDVKPSNIMLEQTTGSASVPITTQRAVLTDFGIAKLLSGNTRITNSGIVGTFDYMAPEQIRDAAHVDGRVDVYALGVLTFQMLTGRVPFTASHPGAVLIAHLQQPVPTPSRLRPDLSEDTSDAILKALAKEPDQRFATAGEFIRAIG